MKIRTLLFCPLAAGLLIAAGSPASGQDKEAGNPAMQEAMKKMMEQATPGDAHKKLDVLAGTWDATMTIWMDGPDKPPMVTKGKTSFKWILGGRFLEEDATGEMMGQPYTGLGILGYDNMNKKYTMMWIDNTSTANFTADGTADPSGTTLTYFGKMDEPVTGEHGKTVKYVLRILGKDKHVFEIHDLSMPEAATKMVEISYTRAH